ncbi:neutral zinc metallopeptidase [Chromobacterium sp. IIBBL 290-4]|uniref:KPN_02809 family neutral zinc metallopeptidase n=1 Tax=Chromobacterium sp. IIBBL 290-4 TaxID=2953890 RepID=UPI0020B8B380|nr:neutral zinc metallopeptidase [Chromobacterium sp. IIBBL 290-4]UTH76005.1 neutral zinc metallopeptidase [Chromobacterium sp. IIBBL 290-4]
MKWQGKRESDNVEDLRDEAEELEQADDAEEDAEDEAQGFSREDEEEQEQDSAFESNDLGTALVVGVLVVAGVIGWLWLSGGNDDDPVSHSAATNGGSRVLAPPAPVDHPGRDNQQTKDRDTAFVKVILADTEDVWGELFRQQNLRYQPPKLVLYTESIKTGGCGKGEVSIGPFYCTGDNKVYLDSTFFRQMRKQLHGKAEFGQAYVVAHEVGHHVQNQLGLWEAYEKQAAGLSKKKTNALSVRMELQADCLAGVWGHYAKQRQLLEFNEVAEGIQAASDYGDDEIMRKAGVEVRPDAFTHGTSEQRVRWFRRGFDSGDMSQCDTFRAARL